MRPDAPRRPGRAGRGYSLLETMVSLVIMSVLIAIGVPRFQVSLEQSRANVAAANLRTLWSAQRLYWLDNRTYAADMAALQSANLIDPSQASATAPYSYQMTTAADGGSFTATATRSGSPSWSGSFSIDSDGNMTGQVQQGTQGTTIAAASLL